MSSIFFEVITKAELAQWVDSDLFPPILPSWVENLVREEAGEHLIECDFPTGDDFTRTGYDGSTNSTKACENVPEGEAKWELGKDVDVRMKAKREYIRVSDMLGEAAKDQTFVFVTPRRFPDRRKDTHLKFNEINRQNWVQARRDEKLFKNVFVIDESTLRKWSAKHFSVALRIKQALVPEFVTSGFELPDDTVRRFVSNFASDQIDASILMCGREKARTLIAAPSEVGDPLVICANSEDEALAFACQAFLEIEDKDIKAERLRKTLVVTSPEALRQFRGSRDKCFILSSEAAKNRHLVDQDNRIIICSALDSENMQSPNIVRDPGSSALAAYLVDKKIPNADKLAEMAGGSLNCLQRLQSPIAQKPPYMIADGKELDHLILAALLGGWSEEPFYSDGEKFESKDISVIKSMIPEDSNFKEFKRTIRKYMDADGAEPSKDALVKKIDSIYWVKAPVDAIDCLLDKMDEEHFESFERALLTIFSEQVDQKYEYGFKIIDHAGYSETIKTGVALSFCILAARGGSRTKKISGLPIKDWIDRVYGELAKKVDYLTLISNEGGLLGYFAEAAPEVFLQALEGQIQGNADGIKRLLSTAGPDSSAMGDNRAAGLLWALMRLAWLPQRFQNVVRVLLDLHRLDPERHGNHSPRPSTVFGGLYAVGASQTSTPTSEQLSALSILIECGDEAAFDLLRSALPGYRGFISSHSKPIFGYQEKVRPPRSELFQLYEGLFQSASNLAKGHPNRIAALIEKLPEMPDSVFEKNVGEWRIACSTFSESENLSIWTQLRNLIVRHTSFPDADWVMPESRTRTLVEWQNQIEPNEEDYAKFLFSASWIEMPMARASKDADESEDEELTLEKKRTELVLRMIGHRGVEFVTKFSSEVAEKGHFGIALAKSIDQLADLENALLIYSEDQKAEKLFYRGCSLAAYDRFKDDWLNSVFANSEIYVENGFFIEMLMFLPLNAGIERYFSSYGINQKIRDQYWENVRVIGLSRDSVDEQVIQELLAHGRHSEVLEALSFSLDKQSDELLVAIVDGYYSSLNSRSPKELSSRTIDAMFKVLGLCKKRRLMALNELAAYEFPLARQLRWTHSGYAFAVHEYATSDPNYFVELLAMKYRTTKPHPGVHRSDVDRTYLGELSFHIFDTMKHPRLQSGEDMSYDELAEWIAAVRESAEEYGLLQSANYQIGEILSQCSEDAEDKIWPRKVVRDAIENLADEKMLSGFRTKNFNSRGVYSDGVNFFTQLAERYERDAERLEKWPKTKRLLLSIAKSDRASAERSAIDDQQFDATPKL